MSLRLPPGTLRRRLHEVIAEAETPAGRAFDLILIAMILTSVATVMLETVPTVRAGWGDWLVGIELAFTAAFTVEYLARLYISDRPAAYARSFFGIVDLLAIVPTYLAILIPGAQALLVIRILRVLRIFRILKLVHFVGEGRVILAALRASRYKISVFLLAVLTGVSVAGSLMYLIEGPQSGYDSIPRGVYWAIVTLTTVGYGDIHPQSPLGQFLAALIMIAGYGVIAVPTGIVTAELTAAGMSGLRPRLSTEVCQQCGLDAHEDDSRFCRRCGAPLDPSRDAAEGGRRTPTATPGTIARSHDESRG